MALENKMTQLLGIRFPIIMAPMFLVSNEPMVNAEAMQAGIMGTFPSLNYRKKGEYEEVLKRINAFRDTHNVTGSYGVNLIVQRTNPMLDEHLEASVRQKVPFYITSLGSPKDVIEKAHSYGAKVFCDVTNVDHARLCVDLGCDGIIAVGQGAGGHAGPYPLQTFVPALRKAFPTHPSFRLEVLPLAKASFRCWPGCFGCFGRHPIHRLPRDRSGRWLQERHCGPWHERHRDDR
jgi:nitronate monooxygenase